MAGVFLAIGLIAGSAFSQVGSYVGDIDSCPHRVGDILEPTNDSTLVPAEFVQDLITWVGDHTEYDIDATQNAPPRIAFCITGEIISYEGRPILVDTDLRAAYDLPNRKIFLVQPWDPADPRDLSRLLHELVHDIQHQNRMWPCLEAPEWEAYKLQDAWLSEQGVASGFDWLRIYFRSQCPRDIHP